jgi:hypothetical protein
MRLSQIWTFKNSYLILAFLEHFITTATSIFEISIYFLIYFIPNMTYFKKKIVQEGPFFKFLDTKP